MKRLQNEAVGCLAISVHRLYKPGRGPQFTSGCPAPLDAASRNFFVSTASTLPHLIAFLISTFYSSSSFRYIGDHKCTLGGPAPPGLPLAEKIVTQAEVLVYAYITVKFQLRSSINVQLTQSSLYNRFCIESFPKMGFWDGFLG